MMNSAVYFGHIRHRRFSPVENAFRYRVVMMYLDLAEVGTVFDGRLLWSYERPNVASWRRQDFIGPRDMPLDEAVRYRARHQGGIEVRGPIRMLARLRYFGLPFTPVTFYYCFDESDSRVEAIVAEITNIPWRERHAYVLTEAMNEASGPRKRYRMSKRFHVSPFMPMDIEYDWRFTEPGENLNIHMIDYREGKKVFDATLTLKRHPITGGSLAKALWLNPVTTVGVPTGIHWQALKLWLKKSPFYGHPQRRPGDDRDPYATRAKAARLEQDGNRS